jgi:hypothetical protein
MPPITETVVSALPLHRHTFLSVAMGVGFFKQFNAISYHSSRNSNRLSLEKDGASSVFPQYVQQN